MSAVAFTAAAAAAQARPASGAVHGCSCSSPTTAAVDCISCCGTLSDCGTCGQLLLQHVMLLLLLQHVMLLLLLLLLLQ
jgi:hypothetical protein